MKSISYKQFATVHGDSASFDVQLNAKVYELKDYYPIVHYSEHIPFYAHIEYTVNTQTPETVAEASELSGVSFVCQQCPYFKPVLKDDGTPDKRVKWGDCDHAELGRTWKMSSACEKLYELIKEGDVKLCFMD